MNRIYRIAVEANRKRLLVPTLVLASSLGFTAFTHAQLDSPARAGTRSATPNARESTTEVARQSSANKPTKFLRVTNDAHGDPSSMQTAITRYRPTQGDLVVDLIGAVHIGEGDYYRQLNNQFKHYDVVLYELVAPQGTRVPHGGKRKSGASSPLDIVSWMQHQTQSKLGLESQLEMIDYQPRNFTHADMSPAQMSKKMADRGDTPLTVGISAISEMMRQQNRKSSNSRTRSANQFNVTELWEALGDPLKMKRMMANQFADAGVMEMGMGGTLNQLLVVDRNEAALRVMQKEIVKGNKKIAIFYGAAHMPDFEKRLTSEFGMKKSKQIWIDAWDLTKAAAPKTSSEGTTKMLFNLIDELSR